VDLERGPLSLVSGSSLEEMVEVPV
jgi:hypothetical protein